MFILFADPCHFKFLLFYVGDYVAIGASGGKDSTVLAYVMKLLNDQYEYGLRLVLLSIGNCSLLVSFETYFQWRLRCPSPPSSPPKNNHYVT